MLTDELSLPLGHDVKNCQFMITDGRLALMCNNPKFAPIYVDFCGSKATWRRLKGGGKGQLIAKALGLKKHPNLRVVDATAGLGTDAFTLATLGCAVTMVERSEIVGALLEDGLNRLKTQDFGPISLELVKRDAIDYLHTLPIESLPDVVYLDPMFPLKSKNALAKKEMRILRELVGDDSDAATLFDVAFNRAQKRVVVKRHRLAPPLTPRKPDLVFVGQSSRFDVYIAYK